MAKLGFEFEVGNNTDRIIDGICGQHGYQEQIEVDDEMVDNPEGKPAFAKRMAMQWIKNNVIAYEANAAANTARDAKIAEVGAIAIE